MGLRQVRQKRGLTQVQLAALSGVEQTNISFLERQKRPNPKWVTVDALAKALKVQPHALFPSYYRKKAA